MKGISGRPTVKVGRPIEAQGSVRVGVCRTLRLILLVSYAYVVAQVLGLRQLIAYAPTCATRRVGLQLDVTLGATSGGGQQAEPKVEHPRCRPSGNDEGWGLGTVVVRHPWRQRNGEP